MTTLTTFILTAIVATYTAGAKVAPPEATKLNLVRLAHVFSDAVEDAPVLPFEGPAAREASAALLAVVAWTEGGYSRDVEQCRRVGDQGRSVSLFQLMAGPARGGHSAKEICASTALSAQLALRTFSLAKTPSFARMINVYATGRETATSFGALKIRNFFLKFAESEKIVILTKEGAARPWAEFALAHPPQL